MINSHSYSNLISAASLGDIDALKRALADANLIDNGHKYRNFMYALLPQFIHDLYHKPQDVLMELMQHASTSKQHDTMKYLLSENLRFPIFVFDKEFLCEAVCNSDFATVKLYVEKGIEYEKSGHQSAVKLQKESWSHFIGSAIILSIAANKVNILDYFMKKDNIPDYPFFEKLVVESHELASSHLDDTIALTAFRIASEIDRPNIMAYLLQEWSDMITPRTIEKGLQNAAHYGNSRTLSVILASTDKVDWKNLFDIALCANQTNILYTLIIEFNLQRTPEINNLLHDATENVQFAKNLFNRRDLYNKVSADLENVAPAKRLKL